MEIKQLINISKKGMKQMDNRQLIMEKALELFCARGYDAVGVQEIAEQSGITKTNAVLLFWK